MNDGGPAFPRPASEDAEHGTLCDGNEIRRAQSGMSLRDYFAAHCPSDLAKCNVQSDAEAIAGPQPAVNGDFRELLAWNNRVEAFIRYAYADAMLEQRKKQ